MDFGIYGVYFTNTRTLISILVPLVGMMLPFSVFKSTQNPRVRSWSLGVMLLCSVFLWFFLGISLVLCYASSEAYELDVSATIASVFGRTLLLAVGAAVPIAVLLRQISPRIVLRKVGKLKVPANEIGHMFETLGSRMTVPAARLRLSPSKVPISFAVDANRPMVVMSESLVSLLRKDELEAVMAHELAHIKNADTSLKAFVTAYKTALPHDPIIRLVEAAFHREREIVADETAAKATGKPLSLASALMKIYDAFPKNNLRSYGTLSILGSGTDVMSRYPPLRQRINQLIRLSETRRQIAQSAKHAL